MSKEEEFKMFKDNIIKRKNDFVLELKKLQTEIKSDYKNSAKIENKINEIIDLILHLENILNIIRIPNEKDMENRKNIYNNFNSIISDIISLDNNLLFLGFNDIETIKNIIKNKSFDFNKSTDLQTSIINAEPGFGSFYPYGAILVFENNNDRLKYIITTDENIMDLKKFCTDYCYSTNIVVNHQEFIDICKNKYNSRERVSVL